MIHSLYREKPNKFTNQIITDMNVPLWGGKDHYVVLSIQTFAVLCKGKFSKVTCGEDEVL